MCVKTAAAVAGAVVASNAASTTASAEIEWTNGSFAGTFEGELSNVTRSYAGKGHTMVKPTSV